MRSRRREKFKSRIFAALSAPATKCLKKKKKLRASAVTLCLARVACARLFDVILLREREHLQCGNQVIYI